MPISFLAMILQVKKDEEDGSFMCAAKIYLYLFEVEE